MSEQTNSERLRDIIKKRHDAFFKSTNEYQKMLEEVADSTTVDDIDFVDQMITELDPETKALVDLFVDVHIEWSKGFRCPVCGLTPNQAKKENYDCTIEC